MERFRQLLLHSESRSFDNFVRRAGGIVFMSYGNKPWSTFAPLNGLMVTSTLNEVSLGIPDHVTLSTGNFERFFR